MRHFILLLLLPGISVAETTLPSEVADYIEHRKLCEHFRQEPWPEGTTSEDKERRDFLAGQQHRYCSGTDRAIQKLKRKYKKDAAVTRELNNYEYPIESRR